MAEDGSSGNRLAGDERLLERVEQRLDGIDETLRNLTQMMTALTAEVRIRQKERRPLPASKQPTNDDSGNDDGEVLEGRRLLGGDALGGAELHVRNPRGGEHADLNQKAQNREA